MNKRIASLALWGLLLVLVLRMTMTETARMTLSQVTGQAAPQNGDAALPEIGPAVTTGLAAVVFVLAGLAAGCGAKAGAMGRARLGRLVVVIAILTLCGLSTFAAANRFLALVGWCDLSMALIAGWSIGVLCDARVLGISGRRTVIAAVVALAAIWTAKGIYQRAIDIPETIRFYQLHRDEALTQALGPNHSTDPDSSEVKLFESRMLSEEVTGYVTLSNVMATGMVGLLAVLAGLWATVLIGRLIALLQAMKWMTGRFKLVVRLLIILLKRSRNSTGSKNVVTMHRPIEIPPEILALIFATLLLIAGLVVTFLTGSRGGSTLAICSILGICLGIWKRNWVAQNRKGLILAIAILLAAGATCVITYGMVKDRLPSKSLMFRWHYWTASAKLVEQSPVLGVGLNNFGDYYTSVKRASSPEDVKDPHSFFVRIAAEAGIPAAVLVLVLIVWLVIASTRSVGVETSLPWNVQNAIAGGVCFCAVWWIPHQLLAEPANEYSAILSGLSAIIAAAGWALACGLLHFCGERGVRFVAMSGVVGAVGMLLYDQINMALVTGPVAMFFWVLLGVGESWSATAVGSWGAVTPGKPGALLGKIGGGVLVVAGVVVAGMMWWPTLRGTMLWDPLPWEEQYLAATQGDRPDFLAAERALDAAILRSPRSTELLRQRVLVKLKLQESTATDVHRILELDRTSARLRVSLAMSDSDLSATERIGMLEEAVRLDAQLPTDETTRLSAQEHQKIEGEIAVLRKKMGGNF